MKKGKPAGVQLLVQAVVRDPDGKVITDTGRKPARSFVIQFLEYIYGCGIGTEILYATATDGTEDMFYHNGASCSLHLQLNAGLTEDDEGIVVGTGDTAETNADYNLDVQLTEGAGAGNITHGESIVGTAAEVGANVDIEIKRTFTNNTGSTITVKEAGIYTSLSTNYQMIVRDVLDTPVEVPDKCSITIIYTVRTTV